MKGDDRSLATLSADAAGAGAARRPWRTPKLNHLQTPAQAEAGILLGPEAVILLS
jgi:hypothetical protein